MKRMTFDQAKAEAVLGRNLRPGEFELLKQDLRVLALKRAAEPPVRCGPEIPTAPARGPMRVVAPLEMVPGSTERFRHAGYKGRDVAICADVFDRIMLAARRSEIAPPLTDRQIEAGRVYRNLTERRAGSGVRCSGLEPSTGGSGDGGGFIDAFIGQGDALRAMHARIGTGVAMELRRVRPSERGSRVAIRDRVMVDMVCLQDADPDAVLRAHGWACKGQTRQALRAALAGVLERMAGFQCVA